MLVLSMFTKKGSHGTFTSNSCMELTVPKIRNFIELIFASQSEAITNPSEIPRT